MEHVDVLRKLQEKWREELGDTEYNSERDVRLLCADELDHVIHALSAQGEAVAYALKNSKTGEMFWDEDECIWSDSSGAEYYAEILNDRGDGEEFAVAPLYTHPQPQGLGKAVRLRVIFPDGLVQFVPAETKPGFFESQGCIVVPIISEAQLAAELLANEKRLHHQSQHAPQEQAAGALDLSAPPRVWLQVDTDGDNDDRSEAIPEKAWIDLTWHYEYIGGQEVQYIRADLAHPQPQGAVVDDAQGEAAAWMASDGRVISARQKERAIRDGGASASSVSVYSDPLYARTQPQGAVLDDAPTAWISDNDLLKLRESVDDARNIRMTTERTHLRIHPVYIPALVAALREGE